MADAPSKPAHRTAVGLLALIVLWVVVYWLWPVDRGSPITLAGGDAAPPAPRGAEGVASGERGAEPAPRTLVLGGSAADRPADAAPADGVVASEADAPEGSTGEAGPIIPPGYVAYTVTAADTSLRDIAARELGDASLWRAIAQANAMRDPERLRPGQVWRIPTDPRNIQGMVADDDGQLREPPAPEPPEPAFTEYRVRKGDTLGAISQRHYGTVRHAELIFEFNRERLGLRSIDSIRVGQVLHIPSDPG